MRRLNATVILIAGCLGSGPSGPSSAQAPASVPELAQHAIDRMQAADWGEAALTYERIVRENPYRADQWHNFGFALHKSGKYAEAVRAWERAANLGFAWDPLWERRLVWDPTWVKAFGPGTPVPWYNIARAQARLGRKDDALRALGRAMDEGFAVEESLREEADFAAIREEPRFRELAGWPPAGTLSRDDRWRFDLEYLARRMPQVHYQLKRKVPANTLRVAIDTLKTRVPQLSDGRILVELQRLAAMAGSGHTRLYWPEEGPYAAPVYSIEFHLYADGLFVRRAAKGLERTVGGRVVEIGTRSAAEALKAVEPLCSVDGPMGLRVVAPALLARPEVLAAMSIAPDPKRVRLIVERPEGERVEAELIPSDAKVLPRSGWVAINARAGAVTTSSLRVNDPLYWFEHLPDERLVYLQYNAVSDRPGAPLAAFFRRVFDFIQEKHAEYLVIDLRHNGGGDGLLNQALIHEIIRCDSINRAGHLFAIIGRGTFSAAVSAASDLERQTHAMFVGEPTCTGPNSVGQATPLRLPCSALLFGCASLHFQGAVLSSDRRPWIAPNIVAEESSADAAANRDPAFEAIHSLIRRRGSPAAGAQAHPRNESKDSRSGAARKPGAGPGR